MYDAASLSDAGTLQRAIGELRVAVRVRDGSSVLARLHQAGCLKARFPRRSDAAWLDLVSLNTSGGVAGGDRLKSRFTIGPGARATIAAQAAERFYRASPGSPPARMRTTIAIAGAGAVEWLPQESILFDGCSLDRRLEIDMAVDASVLGIEWLVFGRAAMGESIVRASIRDLIRVRRGGRLILHDALRLGPAVGASLRRPAIGARARAAATMVLVAPGAEDRIDDVRAVLRGSEAGASTGHGMLLVRALAADALALRRQVIDVLDVLRPKRPLPRVWQC